MRVIVVIPVNCEVHPLSLCVDTKVKLVDL